MDIIADNGQEISLGCFANLHTKMVCVRNGLFAKINKYYLFYYTWSIAINALQ